jgi:hypothetical protein
MHNVAEPDDTAVGGQEAILKAVILASFRCLLAISYGVFAVIGMEVVDPEIRLLDPASQRITENSFGRLADEDKPPRSRVGFPNDGVDVLEEILEVIRSRTPDRVFRGLSDLESFALRLWLRGHNQPLC